jgi:hypothetical protein
MSGTTESARVSLLPLDVPMKPHQAPDVLMMQIDRRSAPT